MRRGARTGPDEAGGIARGPDRRRRRALGMAALSALAPGVVGAKAVTGDVVYVPTPPAVLNRMLSMARVTASDFVMDLGSGDGRLVIEAVKRHGARGQGIDIDPELVRKAEENARREGVGERARFVLGNLFEADLGAASVVTLYLLPDLNLKLRPKLIAELRPGSRVVSHDYGFGEWRPDEQVSFEVPEKKAVTGIPSATVMLWVVPARVAGRWQLSAPPASGLDGAELELRQSFQRVSGQMRAARGASGEFDGGSLRGATLRLPLAAEFSGRSGRPVLVGRVDGDRIEGTLEAGPLSLVIGRVVARRVG